jgi:hypothetical protein
MFQQNPIKANRPPFCASYLAPLPKHYLCLGVNFHMSTFSPVIDVLKTVKGPFKIFFPVKSKFT